MKRFRRCKNPDCFDFETGKRAVVRENRAAFCSRVCAGVFRRGRNVNGKNYIRIRIDGKRVYLHRWKMQQILGRPLLPEEIVHHIDFDPFNDDDDNLRLFPNQSAHLEYHRANPFPPGKAPEMIQNQKDDIDFWQQAARRSPIN